MANRKRSEWLDDIESADSDQGYDTDIAEKSKGQAIGGRSWKRRKLAEEEVEASSGSIDDRDSGISRQEQHSGEENYGFEDEEEPYGSAREVQVGRAAADNSDTGGDEQAAEAPDEEISTSNPSYSIQRSKSALAKKLAKSAKTTKKSGVVYLSRVPPFMKPHTVKHFLSAYAPSGLGRIFLTPESRTARTSRLHAGGNRKRNFTDGWIEFTSKREAKVAVETLNARTIGGKKGGYYCDDVWNLKYLRGFKWRHLTEQIANENAERAARLRAEDAKERREVREYLRNVEFAKMVEGMRKKEGRKGERKGEAAERSVGAPAPAGKRGQDHLRLQFRQAEVRSKPDNGAKEMSADIKTLSRIF